MILKSVFVFFFFLLSCSHQVKNEAVKNDLLQDENFKNAVAGALREGNIINRKLANEESAAFQKINPNPDFFVRETLEMIVIPKVNSSSEKNSIEREVVFGRPLVFQIKPRLAKKCKQIRDGEFSNKFDLSIFPKNNENNCFVLGFVLTSPKIKPGNFSNPSAGHLIPSREDFFESNLYIDSNYQAYGIEFEKYINRNLYGSRNSLSRRQKIFNSTLVGFKLDPDNHVSSGLNFFPMEVFNFSKMNEKFQNLSSSEISIPDNLANEPEFLKIITGVEYSEKKICNGYQVTYANTYDSKVNLAWCENEPWPTVIETGRYIAFRKRN